MHSAKKSCAPRRCGAAGDLNGDVGKASIPQIGELNIVCCCPAGIAGERSGVRKSFGTTARRPGHVER